MGSKLDRMLDLRFLAKVLDLSAEEDEMQLPDTIDNDIDIREIEISARETGLDSLSSEEPLSLPVYCDREWRWNIFSAKNGTIEHSLLLDDGRIEKVGCIDATQIKLGLPGDGGRTSS